MILLWCLSLSAFAEPDRSQDEPDSFDLQAQGIIIQVPLDLTVIGQAAVIQIAASFAAMLPAAVQHYNGYEPLAPLTLKMVQQFGWVLSYLNRPYQYSLLHPWIVHCLAPKAGFSKFSPPAQETSTITSEGKPRHRNLPQIALDPSFHVEKNLSGGLSALIGYLAELSGTNTPLNQPLVSTDKVANLSVLQNDNDNIRLSATILDGRNATHEFLLGRDKSTFWIERLNQKDITPAMRVVWNAAQPGSQTIRLSVQLPDPVSQTSPGKLWRIKIPEWLTRHLLAKSTAEALKGFSELILNWRLPQIASGLFSESPKSVNKRCNSLTAPLWHSKNDIKWLSDSLSTVNLMLSNSKSVPTSPSQEQNGAAALSTSGTGQTTKSDNDIIRRHDSQEDDNVSDKNNGDDNNPSAHNTDSKLAHQEVNSLLWQVTEAFYSHDTIQISLDESYQIISGLSSVGLAQVLPVNLVQMSQWPLVMSKSLVHFLRNYLNADDSIIGEPLAGSEYVYKVSPKAFDQLMKEQTKVAELIEARKTLYSLINELLDDYCGSEEHCYFGGEAVRAFIRKHFYGYNPLFKGNLPVSNDIDALIPDTDVETFVQFITDKLTGYTLKGDLRTPNLAIAFSDARPGLFFNVYKLEFSLDRFDKELLPGLDFAIANQKLEGPFLSPETIVYESIKRGCGPTTDCRSKHVDRLLLLNALFPSVSMLNDLMRQLIPGSQTEEFSTNSLVLTKEQEIAQLKQVAKTRLKEAQIKRDKLKTDLFMSKEQNQALEGKLASLQKTFDTQEELIKSQKGKLTYLQKAFNIQREELMESQRNSEQLSIKLNKVRSKGVNDEKENWKLKVKALESDLSTGQLELEKEKEKSFKLNNKNIKMKLSLTHQKEQLTTSESTLAEKDEKIQTLSDKNKHLQEQIKALYRQKKYLKVGFGFLAIPSIAMVTKEILKHYHKMTPVVCGQLSYEYSKRLCSFIKYLDSATLEIIKTMDRLSGHHRVVKYKVFPANLETGQLSHAINDPDMYVLRKTVALNGHSLLLLYESHTYWENMNVDELAQIVLALSHRITNNSRKPVGTLADYIEGTIAYCGYMPNERWQRECTDRAIDRIFTQGYLPEEFNTVKIDEPDVQTNNRYIAFLPVWNVSKQRMTWHDIWPYRLDTNGYHLLGNSSEQTAYNYKCDEPDKESQLRLFIKLKWQHFGNASCDRNMHVQLINVPKNVVIWFSSYHRYKYYINQARSYDEQGIYLNAWRNPSNNLKPSM
ncbi:hypothetical protein [Endozoicomonas euniceicola]|uniref:Uncharacterized protein n=1 Tax=Endozoicomonas euniceicola TaxID=1234143 RepID=A0ABY6GTL5_9GAMM|nr:hypothetical protein [Endozoicomonas euniceicola]UYM16113.1 hypothetical protein NX720_25485 [Endozoicomonas euniceicola]